MFSTLYEPCLENIFLARLSSTPVKHESCSNGKSDSQITTLGDVVRMSRYVLFCLFRSSSPTALEFITSVRNFVTHKNSNNSRKNSTNSSPMKLKKLFGLKKKKKCVNISNELAVIVVDLEPNSVDFNVCQITESGFYFLLDSQQYTTKSRLLRALNFRGTAPAIIVLDSAELNITTTQARRMLIDDPLGDQFPWTDPSVLDVFKGQFVRNGSKTGSASSSLEYDDFSTLKPCVKGLYFGAKWCPPCRVISKQLISAYEKMKAKNLNFEIFFCSSDRSVESFCEHFATMPWLAFPFDTDKTSQLTRAFDINGIPSFILLDEDNQLISRHGRSVLLSDMTFKNFPWKRSAIYELNEFTMHRIVDFTSLILFTEGSPDDNEFSQQILKPCADVLLSQMPRPNLLTKNLSVNDEIVGIPNMNITQMAGTSNTESSTITETANGDNDSITSVESIPAWADPIQVFFTGEDPICDFILESIGQGQADLPLLVICDVLAGHMAICEQPDVSETIVSDFVSVYRRGKANVQPLPATASGGVGFSEDRRVGGIPVNLIEQIMQQQQDSLKASPTPAPISPSA